MNRDDLLKRCVDRRVAHETSVVAVSHLFYVYLLSALRKGQQVEVPNFGTFGTRMIGVKRQRRMPFFKVEEELAEKVNERYRTLKTDLIGRYELIPVEGEVAYSGAAPAYDRYGDPSGKDIVVEAEGDIAVGGFGRGGDSTKSFFPGIKPVPPPDMPEREEPFEPPRPAEQDIAPRLKERKLMPRPSINLRDEGMQDETQPIGPAPEEPQAPPPTLRDLSGGDGPSPILQILLGLVILGAITFALNYFGIIHLWGKKVQTAEDSLPPPVQTAPTEESASQEQTLTPGTEQKIAETATPTPIPVPKTETKTPAVASPPKPTATTPQSGTGTFTIQVSSWASRSDADRVAQRLSGAGFDAYVAEGLVRGRTWYRVRVGRYATSADAQGAATKLKDSEEGVWVTRVD